MARTEEPGPIVRVMTAAAQRLGVNAKGKTTGKPPREDWQQDAWDIFDEVPEVGQAVTFIANVVGGVRLFIAEMPDGEDEPVPVAAGTLGGTEAEQVLGRLSTGSIHGGIGGLLVASVQNLKVPGDCYLLGEDERPGDPAGKTAAERADRPERWAVKSIDEVKVLDAGKAEIRDRPGDRGRQVRFGIPEDQRTDKDDVVFLLRVWDRHPRYADLARSSLRPALGECDLLLTLTRAIRRQALSRLAAAGILTMASELDVPGSPTEGDDRSDPTVTPFMAALAKAMLEPIEDDGSPDGQVPIVVQGPHQFVKDGLNLTRLAQTFDPEAREIRKELIQRLDAVLDIPIGQVTPQAADNRTWRGTFLIDGQSWTRYGEPTTRLIVQSWTEGLLWPMLDEAGIDPLAARKLCIWYDATDVILDPDESKTADELFDRGAIDWESYRRRKGAGEDEAPDDAELDRRQSLGLFRGATATQDPNMGAGEAQTAALGPLVAAQRQPLGRRLMEVDRALRGRLEEAAEATIHRALSRAGARVRSRAQRDDNLAATLAKVPAHLVAHRTGRATVAALELDESELLFDGVDDMAPRFEARVSAAQRQVRRMLRAEFDLSDAELELMEQRQDRDRAEAWVWLSGALLALAKSRLFDPTPQVQQRGEGDLSATVPTSLIREAMSRAGGGALGEGLPLGGVAVGQLVLDTFAQHGQVVGGWQWVYGDPANPFPGHENLADVEFASWDDPVLLVQPGDEWLDALYYRPSDHAGCQCDFIPLSTDEPAPTDEERVSELMDALG